jgi:hypothetical protein
MDTEVSFDRSAMPHASERMQPVTMRKPPRVRNFLFTFLPGAGSYRRNRRGGQRNE